MSNRFRSGSLFVIIAIAVSLPATSHASAQALPSWYDSLRQYLQAVPLETEGAAAELTQAAAYDDLADAAGALPDPRFVIGVQAVPTDFNLDREPMTQAPLYGLAQVIPFPGRLAAKSESIRAEGRAAKARAQATAQAHGLAWSAAVFRYVQAQRDEAAVDSTLRWLALLRQSAEAMYTSGHGHRHDVAQIMAEIGRLRATRSEILADAAVASANARRVLNAEMPTLSTDRSEPWAYPADVTERVVAGNPGVHMAAARQEAAEQRTRGAKHAFGPDIAVELGYGRRAAGRRDLVQGKLGLSLPLWAPWSQLPDLRGHRKAEVAAELRRRDVVREAAAMARVVSVRLADAIERQRLYEESVLVDVRAARDSAEAAYDSGAVDIFVPIEAIRRDLVSRREYAAIVARRQTLEARLLALMGALVPQPSEETK